MAFNSAQLPELLRVTGSFLLKEKPITETPLSHLGIVHNTLVTAVPHLQYDVTSQYLSNIELKTG